MPDWSQLRGRKNFGTFRGRTAIELACRIFGLGPDHEVLFPAYNCGTELDAIRCTGANIIPYPVSRRCEVDLADLHARRTAKTRIVYLIHYFGWETPAQAIRDWCDREGFLLFEDCALSLFSEGPSGQLGRLGEASIYSLPKTLGSVHGGILSLDPRSPGPALPLLDAEPALFRREILHSAKHRLFNALDRVSLLGPLQGLKGQRRRTPGSPAADTLPAMPDDYYFSPATEQNRSMHPRLFPATVSTQPDGIRTRRRENYLLLSAALTGTPGLRLLFDLLPQNVCPLSLPLCTERRNDTVARLQACGIAALPWWAGYHQEGMDWNAFPDACWLKDHVFTLPIHQCLDAGQIDYIAHQTKRCVS